MSLSGYGDFFNVCINKLCVLFYYKFTLPNSLVSHNFTEYLFYNVRGPNYYCLTELYHHVLNNIAIHYSMISYHLCLCIEYT